MSSKIKKIAIIGGGNIGTSIAKGLLRSGEIIPSDIFVTRRKVKNLDELKNSGVKTGSDNIEAINESEIIILAVLPSQLMDLITSIAPAVKPEKHILVSLVTAFNISELKERLGKENVPFIRVMPNIAAAVCESMSCISSINQEEKAMEDVKKLFDIVGSTLIIPETLMASATILAACGIAFFMRYIRAASQGGIQVGFHANEAQLIAAQTARGATSLLLESGNHPEREIDKVTTPMGCTIAGLNEMEHNGLSSALIKGIVLSFNEINKLK